MNPLSSLNLSVTPELRADLMARAAQGSFTGTIPAGELQKLAPHGDLASSGAVGQAQSPGSFSNLLGNMVEEVNARQVAANDSVTGLLNGQNVNLHQAMIAMEEASVSFQLMVEVRNKLLDSYQELMRMQI
jgi:flagellar hook-basal body complex protein FliE